MNEIKVTINRQTIVVEALTLGQVARIDIVPGAAQEIAALVAKAVGNLVVRELALQLGGEG